MSDIDNKQQETQRMQEEQFLEQKRQEEAMHLAESQRMEEDAQIRRIEEEEFAEQKRLEEEERNAELNGDFSKQNGGEFVGDPLIALAVAHAGVNVDPEMLPQVANEQTYQPSAPQQVAAATLGVATLGAMGIAMPPPSPSFKQNDES